MARKPSTLEDVVRRVVRTALDEAAKAAEERIRLGAAWLRIKAKEAMDEAAEKVILDAKWEDVDPSRILAMQGPKPSHEHCDCHVGACHICGMKSMEFEKDEAHP